MNEPERIAQLLLLNLADQLQNEDNENYIDINQIDLTDFFHALANVLPTYVFNKHTGDNKNQLEFNHVANQLCFQYYAKQDKSE